MANKNVRTNSESVNSRAVLEMVTVANEYCRFLEKCEDYPTDVIFQFIQKILPLIYLKSSLLPEVDVTDENAIEHYVTEEQWESLFNTLHIKFGSSDEFYYIDLQEQSHQDPVRGSIAEFLTDVYQDLQDFLLLYQNPLRTFRENAVSDCRRLFETRFGIKMIYVQAATHSILYSLPDQDSTFIY